MLFVVGSFSDDVEQDVMVDVEKVEHVAAMLSRWVPIVEFTPLFVRKQRFKNFTESI